MTESSDRLRGPSTGESQVVSPLRLEVPDSESPSPVLGVPADAASPDDVEASAAGEPAEPTSERSSTVVASGVLSEIRATMARLVAESEKHHRRATHREAVIDNLHAELERLRSADRRGAVHPLLVALSRVRNDLLRQSAELPADFDATRARKLLRSFADSIEITLEDFGIAACAPRAGDEFDARRHRAVTAVPSADPALARRIATVMADGYQDVQAGAPLTQAQVAVYVAAPAADVGPPSGS
jgi:molecular chaperone GrpE